jgi:hypothetical protein
MMIPNAPRNFYAGHKRHRVVKDGNIRAFLKSLGDRLIAVLRLSNDLPTETCLQKSTESRSDRFMIVSYENPLHDRTNLR